MQKLLYTTLRFIARHVDGFFKAVGAFITIGLVVALVAGGLFAAVADEVMEGATQRFDEIVLTWFAQQRRPALDSFMHLMSMFGSAAVLATLILLASVFLWRTHHRWSVYLLLIGIGGAQILNLLLKAIFNRARPSIVTWETSVRTLSFPSGHAMSSVVAYGAAAYLVGRIAPTSLLRKILLVVAPLLILGIGISRMYLGVHYPTDVVAGFMAGAAWLGILIYGLTALRFFARRRPQTHTEERDLGNPS